MFEKIRSLIFKFDPEKAHDLAIHALKTNIVPIKIKNYQSLKVKFLENPDFSHNEYAQLYKVPSPITVMLKF